MDKGTVIRTVLLFISLANQLLISLGKAPIPLNEQQIDSVYTVISTAVTIVLSVWAWFKNNYVTKKGRQQKQVLQQNNLTK